MLAWICLVSSVHKQQSLVTCIRITWVFFIMQVSDAKQTTMELESLDAKFTNENLK